MVDMQIWVSLKACWLISAQETSVSLLKYPIYHLNWFDLMCIPSLRADNVESVSKASWKCLFWCRSITRVMTYILMAYLINDISFTWEWKYHMRIMPVLWKPPSYQNAWISNDKTLLWHTRVDFMSNPWWSGCLCYLCTLSQYFVRVQNRVVNVWIFRAVMNAHIKGSVKEKNKPIVNLLKLLMRSREWNRYVPYHSMY